MQDRIEVFEQMLTNDPENTMVMFGLAKEYEKLGRHTDVIRTLEDYLANADDEGNADKRHVDAEMIVYGSTKADSRVTVGGEPIKVRPDGTFTLRLAMPDKRQVIPVVAASADGVEQRTVVLAVERNTKVLEPMMKDAAGE